MRPTKKDDGCIQYVLHDMLTTILFFSLSLVHCPSTERKADVPVISDVSCTDIVLAPLWGTPRGRGGPLSQTLLTRAFTFLGRIGRGGVANDFAEVLRWTRKAEERRRWENQREESGLWPGDLGSLRGLPLKEQVGACEMDEATCGNSAERQQRTGGWLNYLKDPRKIEGMTWSYLRVERVC